MFSIKKLSSVLLLGLWVFTGLFAQNLIKYLPESARQSLDEDQRHYHEVVMSWPYAVSSKLVSIDVSLFEQDEVVFNLNKNTFTAQQVKLQTPDDPARRSWLGKFPGMLGDVYVVHKKNEVVGLVQIEDLAFLIRPLGGGLHALVEWDLTKDENCLTPAGDRFELPGGNNDAKYKHLPHPDLDKKVQQEEPSSSSTTGECNVRVLVAYTDDVDDAATDILMDIINMVNMANAGYLNSSTGSDDFEMSIELAVAYEVNYNETGDMGMDLDCITLFDGCLDGIHTQRQLWDADQCVLLTVNGTGLGWVSTDYEDQFTVTGMGNFNAFTFHHELGHNAGCTHAVSQAVQPGTAPWAGWGEPGGCFRTVMAYQDACGMDPCPRHNIFSDDDANTWMCGGNSYTPGDANARNQDRLTLSAPILVDHETVSNNLNLSDDYNWQAREAVHVAANNTVTYNSPANNFEFFNSSLGSFRASDRVTLGQGFWARSGTQFRAYLENCNSITALTDEDLDDRSTSSEAEESTGGEPGLQFRPNPFSSAANVEFEIAEEEMVQITLWDPMGRLVQIVLPAQIHPAGQFSIQLDQPAFPPGLYLLKMIVGKKQKYLKVIRN